MLLTILAVVIAFFVGMIFGVTAFKDAVMKDGYLIYIVKDKYGKNVFRVFSIADVVEKINDKA